MSFFKLCTCSVLHTHSLEMLGRAKAALAKETIPYKTKTENRDSALLSPGRGTARSQFGSFGSKAAEQYSYELFVPKAEKENALYALREVMRT